MKLSDIAWLVMCLLVDAAQTIRDLYLLEDWRMQTRWLQVATFLGQLAGKTQRRWNLRDASPSDGT